MRSVVNIKKYYEGQLLLKDVTFDVEPDETICLLGPSGSGKSTLLRIIAGLEEAEAGKVLWNGKDLTHQPPHQRHFGLMFQDYALFPHKNVAENIAFGLKMQKQSTDQIQNKIARALKTIEMVGFADRKVTDLSGGEQQRVALARALAPEPRLLMLDEPLGALDRTLREQLGFELRQILRRTKIPAIYVTHDQDEANSIADRLLLLHDGVILQSGKPQDFYFHPRNVWVAKFFGLGNLIPGKVIAHSPLEVETSFGRFFASCDDNKPQIGDKTTLLFRPNQAIINPLESENSFTGTAVDQVFRGENYRVTLRLDDQTPSFTILSPIPLPLGEGQRIGYPSSNILCLGED
jgi:ABC-type Fe3+/spermidine/putrescine transport system ATPase subunit